MFIALLYTKNSYEENIQRLGASNLKLVHTGIYSLAFVLSRRYLPKLSLYFLPLSIISSYIQHYDVPFYFAHNNKTSQHLLRRLLVSESKKYLIIKHFFHYIMRQNLWLQHNIDYVMKKFENKIINCLKSTFYRLYLRTILVQNLLGLLTVMSFNDIIYNIINIMLYCVKNRPL